MAPALGKYRDEVTDIPTTEKRTPMPDYFDKPAAYYAEMLNSAIALYDARPRPAQGDVELIYPCQVAATWGLIFRGKDSIPFALDLLKSPVAEGRETAAAVLAEVGRDESVVTELLLAFDAECAKTNNGETGADTLETLDSMLCAFGRMKAKRTIQSVANVLANPNADGDTRHLAAESLGRIVGRRFDKRAEPIAEALAWLAKHPEYTQAEHEVSQDGESAGDPSPPVN